MQKLAIFREYDIRGIYGEDLTQENVVKIGFLIGKELLKRGGKTLGVGYDARLHSKQIFTWFCSGVIASGAIPYCLGAIPTPVGYFSLYSDFEVESHPLTLDGSVMITGSHNPPKYNGFKITLCKEPFFGDSIYALERDFYALDYASIAIKEAREIPTLNVLDKYVEYLVKEFSHLRGFKIPVSLDCGNGIAGVGIARILEKLGIDYEMTIISAHRWEFPKPPPRPK